MNEKLAQQIRNCPNLPSLPAVAVQVVELAQNNDADIAEIARVISKDPALAGKILKTVNSSFYGRSKNVSTISQALVILGLQSVRTLVLGFSLVNTLAKNKSKAFPHVLFWRHSLISATAAKMIAAKTGVADPEEAFLAALLMDIGMLALDLVIPDEYADICEKAVRHADLCASERTALETDHAEVAGFLADLWKLPPMLQAPVAFHHDPSKVTDPQQRSLVELIGLASRCADVFVDTQAAEPINEARAQLQASYSIPQAEADALFDDVGKRINDLASLFEINIGAMQGFDAILKKASDTLVKISLQARKPAPGQMPAANIDARPSLLTGEETLLPLLNTQLEQALSKKSFVSIMLIDLDQNALMQSTTGSTATTAARDFIGRVACAAARQGDLKIVRGGGLALIMPGGDRNAATNLAERIRRAVEARPVPIGKQATRVTVSIGIATFQPGSPFRSAEHLLKAAAASLTAASRTKNCVKIFTLPRPPAAAA